MLRMGANALPKVQARWTPKENAREEDPERHGGDQWREIFGSQKVQLTGQNGAHNATRDTQIDGIVSCDITCLRFCWGERGAG